MSGKSWLSRCHVERTPERLEKDGGSEGTNARRRRHNVWSQASLQHRPDSVVREGEERGPEPGMEVGGAGKEGDDLR